MPLGWPAWQNSSEALRGDSVHTLCRSFGGTLMTVSVPSGGCSESSPGQMCGQGQKPSFFFFFSESRTLCPQGWMSLPTPPPAPETWEHLAGLGWGKSGIETPGWDSARAGDPPPCGRRSRSTPNCCHRCGSHQPLWRDLPCRVSLISP